MLVGVTPAPPQAPSTPGGARAIRASPAGSAKKKKRIAPTLLAPPTPVKSPAKSPANPYCATSTLRPFRLPKEHVRGSAPTLLIAEVSLGCNAQGDRQLAAMNALAQAQSPRFRPRLTGSSSSMALIGGSTTVSNANLAIRTCSTLGCAGRPQCRSITTGF